MYVKSKMLLFLFVCLFAGNSNAQHTKFNGGIVVGLNFSELEGDGITDYFGLNTGIIGTARLSKHSQLGMELLFSQNGEYILPDYYPTIEYGQVRLNHLEVPVYINWLIGVFKSEKFYDLNLNIGFAYTRLVSYKVKDIYKTDVSDQIIYENTEAILFQAGTTYFFTKKTGLNFKASLPIRIEGLSWTLAARVIYMVN